MQHKAPVAELLLGAAPESGAMARRLLSPFRERTLEALFALATLGGPPAKLPAELVCRALASMATVASGVQ